MSLLIIHNSVLKYLENIENKETFYLFKVQSDEIIQEYKKILNTPEIRYFFLKKDEIVNNNKNNIIQSYINLLNTIPLPKNNNFIIELYNEIQENNKKYCSNCEQYNTLQEDENNYLICLNCSSIIPKMIANSSLDDIGRINITQKYIYDRKSHFKDCIKQYQAKQNVIIPQKILEDIENILEKNHLLVGDKNTPKEERFKNITKSHILAYLKNLGLSQHNENIHLIYTLLTDKKPADISHLEIKILNDFDNLSNEYDRLNIGKGKSNFINCQYILYQLLKHNGYNCNSKDFLFLNSLSKKRSNDEICKPLFQELGINIH